MKEDWKKVVFDEVLIESRNGFTGRPNDKSIGNPRIGITAITQSKSITVDVEDYRYIKIPSEKKNRYSLCKDDIMVCRQNGNRHFVGLFGVIKKKVEGLIFSDSLIRFRLIPETMSSDFIAYFMNSSARREVESLCSTTAGNFSINSTSIKSIEIPIAPFVEQKAIVKKIEELFSSLDSGIADLKKAQDQLVIYRQAVLKKAFEGELTKEWREKQTEIEEWNNTTIGEITNVKGGKRLPKGHKYTDDNTNIYYLRVKDFGVNQIDKSDLKQLTYETQKLIERYIINKGDVYISIAGTIGKAGWIHDDLDGANLTENAAKILGSEVLFDKYLVYCLNSINSQIQIKALTKATSQPKLALFRIKTIKIPLPSIKEQHQIVQEIESRLSVCDTVEKDIADSLEKAQALRQSILKKAFEGKLLNEEEIAACKAHPDYEPASVLLEKIKAKKKEIKLKNKIL